MEFEPEPLSHTPLSPAPDTRMDVNERNQNGISQSLGNATIVAATNADLPTSGCEVGGGDQWQTVNLTPTLPPRPRSRTRLSQTSANDDNLATFQSKLFGNSKCNGDYEEREKFLTNGSDAGTSSTVTAPLSSATNSEVSVPPWTTRNTNQIMEEYHSPHPTSNAGGRRRTRPPSPKGSANHWMNSLNLSLFSFNLFSAAAESMPITLVPTIGAALSTDASSFASRAAASAVLGTSFGKFINGPACDLFGASRIACLYSLLLGASLLGLSICTSEDAAVAACATIEFFSSVTTPCVVIVLAAHYRDDDNDNDHEEQRDSESNLPEASHGEQNPASRFWGDVEQHGVSTLREPKAEGRYEGGIYVASLGSRFGSLLAIPCSAMLLNSGWGWRVAAGFASLLAFASFAVLFLFVSDSPNKRHDPQNPIEPATIIFAKSRLRRGIWGLLPRFQGLLRGYEYLSISWSVIVTNIIPALRSVVTSGAFWIVAVAHAGGSIIRSSERILGTYIRDTSGGTISDDKAGSFTIFLSLGICFGLAFGGNSFTQMAHQPQKRKKLIALLYGLAISMCYALSFLASPFVRSILWSPKLVTMLQIVATFVMGAGIAVQYYQIPAIVGATFGRSKGLYSAYTDGVAYGVSSVIWRVVGGAVEEGHPEKGGWAYGWAAVALLLVLCSVLMMQFVEHYFCRGGWKYRMERATPDVAMEKRACGTSAASTNTRVGGDGTERHGNQLRRRNHIGISSPRRPLGDVLAAVHVKHINMSPVKFFHSLRSKSALGELEDDDCDEQAGNEAYESDDEDSTVLFDSISGPVTFDDDALFPPTADDYKHSKPKSPSEELLDRVTSLLVLEDNCVCVDCSRPFPRWSSIIVEANPVGRSPIGCFCCYECVAFHRQLGTHIVKVSSVDHDTFRMQDVEALEAGGNTKVNAWLEATLYRNGGTKPGPHASNRIRAHFIRYKYEERRWCSTINLGAGIYKNNDISMAVGDLLGLSQPTQEDGGESIELVQSYAAEEGNLAPTGTCTSQTIMPTNEAKFNYSSQDMITL